MAERVKLSEDVPAAAAAVSGERRDGLGLHVYGQVLVLYVGASKTFGTGTVVRSFKGWWARGGGSEAWFSVRDPGHLQLLEAFVEGTQVYVTGTLQVTKGKSGSLMYTTVRVHELEKV